MIRSTGPPGAIHISVVAARTLGNTLLFGCHGSERGCRNGIWQRIEGSKVALLQQHSASLQFEAQDLHFEASLQSFCLFLFQPNGESGLSFRLTGAAMCQFRIVDRTIRGHGNGFWKLDDVADFREQFQLIRDLCLNCRGQPAKIEREAVPPLETDRMNTFSGATDSAYLQIVSAKAKTFYRVWNGTILKCAIRIEWELK